MAGGRARAELAAANNPQLLDQSWKKFKYCEYCGRQIMVNNYEDRASRTPMFLGLVICRWCDPRHPDDAWKWRANTKNTKPRIRHPILYRTIISVWLARQTARGGDSSKLQALAHKFWDETGNQVEVSPTHDEATSTTAGQRP